MSQRSRAAELGRGELAPPQSSWLKIWVIFSANSAVARRNACFEIVCGNLVKGSGNLLFTCIFIYG